VWSESAVTARYVPHAMDLVFDFDFGQGAGLALQTGLGGILAEVLDEVAAYPAGHAATFLTNHDQERVWSAVSRGAPDEFMLPIARLLATLLLTSPGTPFVYYGEEIGLAGAKPDERIRTPMPWTGEGPGVGFTTGEPWEAPDPGFAERSVAAQAGDAGSLLSHYRSLIHYRNGSAALRFGDLAVVDTGNDRVAAYLRSAGDDHVLVIVNLTGDPISDYALSLAEGSLEGVTGAEMVAGSDTPAAAPAVTAVGGFEGYRPLTELPPFAALVLHLTGE
jgi:glycosidase